MLDDIAANLSRVNERIALAAERGGRSPAAVTLVAVSKTMDVERIRRAIAAGVTHLGENRVQEAAAKFAMLGEQASDKVGREGITLDMIGTLQRNKARTAVGLFDRVQSLDRPELAVALERAAVVERRAVLPVLVEVNLTGEASKTGVPPDGFGALLDALASCPHLLGTGLMTVARMGADEKELRHTFSLLREMLGQASACCPGEWRDLSMGMTGDFEVAVEEGATIVRIGRAIFGEREYAAARETG